MKKLILVTAVAAVIAGNTANAATVFEGKGITYELKADWQIQLRQKAGDNKKLDVEFDDLELKNRLSYKINDNLKAFGQLDFSFDGEGNKSTGDSAKLEEAYIGFDFGNVAVAIGRQNLAGDEFGIEAALETHTAQDGFEQVKDKGDDVIRVDAKFDKVTVIASTLLGAETSSNAAGEAFDVFVAAELGDLELATAYQTYNDNTAGASDVDTWGVSASYNAGFATLAADYSTTDYGSGSDQDIYNLAAKFKVSKTTKVAVGIVNVDDGSDDTNEWYANVVYKFPSQKNVSLFAEIADTDETDVDLGYLTGVRVTF